MNFPKFRPFLMALVGGSLVLANSSAAAQTTSAPVPSDTDLKCAVRLMFVSVRAAEEAQKATDPDRRKAHSENAIRADRGFSFFIGRINAAATDPALRTRSNAFFESMRSESGAQMSQATAACIEIATGAEQQFVDVMKVPG